MSSTATEAARPRYMTPEQFAAQIGVDLERVREWVRRRHLPYIRLGKDVLIPEDALERLLPLSYRRRHSDPQRSAT